VRSDPIVLSAPYLKQRIADGERLIGAGIFTDSPDVIEYAAVGMDWVWWECQHTHGTWQNTVHGVRAAHAMGIPTLVRTWTHDGGTIERLLDTGAEGIIVPMVNTVEQAERIVQRCYYPPLGDRSFGSIRAERVEPELDAWNRRIVVLLQIESPAGVEAAEAIARVPGVDALHVGGRDLAVRLGLTATEYDAYRQVEREMERVVRACKTAGKAAAAVTLTEAAMEQAVAQGYTLICAGFDLDHLEADYRRMREALGRIGAP